MNKNIVFKIAFILFLTYFLQLRWAPYDNQYYIRTNPSEVYTFFIMGPLWRFPLLAFLGLYFRKIYYGMRLLGPGLVSVYIFSTLSSAWSIDFSRTISGVLDLSLLIGYLIVAVRILGGNEVIRTIWYFGMAVISVSSVLALAGDPHVLMSSSIHTGLWRGLFNHKNVFAPFVATILLISVFGFKLLRIGRWMRYGSIALCLACLVLAGSSTSLLALALAVVVAQLASMKIETARLRLLTYFVLVFPLVGAAIVGFSALDTVVEGVGRDVTLSGRTEIWQGALPFTFSAPFGYGYKTAGGEEVLNAIRASSGWQFAQSVHNVYISMALDIGWPVTLIFVYVLLAYTVVIRKDDLFETRRLLAGVAVLHLTIGMTEVVGGTYSSVHLVVVLWGILSINGYFARKAEAANEEFSLGAMAPAR